MRDDEVGNRLAIKPHRELPSNAACHKLYSAAMQVLNESADGLTIDQAGQLASMARGVANKLSGWRFARTS